MGERRYQPPVLVEGDARFREQPIQPDAAAFLIIDMQNMECVPKPGSDAKTKFFERLRDVVIPNQVALVSAARRTRLEVLYTVIESLTLDGRDRSLDHKISGLHAPKGSWEGRVIEPLAPDPNDIVIPKTASGVFNSTNIDYVLRNLGIRFLVVMGVVTDQCVESAVRDAADRGFLVTQVEDACAAYSPERHSGSCAAMDGHYARVISTRALLDELSQHSRARGNPSR